MPPSVVFVVGTTGVGKSQLAIDLASLCRGHVINADSMQVYTGADILTNKVRVEDTHGIPHSLLSFVPPEHDYHVGDFVRDARRQIQECIDEGETPIVVGGTAYYVQHLLFEGNLASIDGKRELSRDPLSRLRRDERMRARLDALPPELLQVLEAVTTLPHTPSPSSLPFGLPHPSLPADITTPASLASAFYESLMILDPVMAQRWHPRDIRKIRRNIEICIEHGRPASDVIAEQARPKARYRSLIFWLRSDPIPLEERLDGRVYEMIRDGAIDEVRDLAGVYGARDPPYDATSGVFQAIGFRELYDYLYPPDPCCPPDERQHPADVLRLEHAVKRMQLSTRQYARRQLQWLHNRLLPAALSTPETAIVVLDACRGEEWDDGVLKSAKSRLQEWLAGHPMPPMPPEALAQIKTVDAPDELSRTTSQHLRLCEACSDGTGSPVRLAPGQWALHCASKKHRHHQQSAMVTAG